MHRRFLENCKNCPCMRIFCIVNFKPLRRPCFYYEKCLFLLIKCRLKNPEVSYEIWMWILYLKRILFHSKMSCQHDFIWFLFLKRVMDQLHFHVNSYNELRTYTQTWSKLHIRLLTDGGFSSDLPKGSWFVTMNFTNFGIFSFTLVFEAFVFHY